MHSSRLCIFSQPSTRYQVDDVGAAAIPVTEGRLWALRLTAAWPIPPYLLRWQLTLAAIAVRSSGKGRSRLCVLLLRKVKNEMSRFCLCYMIKNCLHVVKVSYVVEWWLQRWSCRVDGDDGAADLVTEDSASSYSCPRIVVSLTYNKCATFVPGCHVARLSNTDQRVGRSHRAGDLRAFKRLACGTKGQSSVVTRTRTLLVVTSTVVKQIYFLFAYFHGLMIGGHDHCLRSPISFLLLMHSRDFLTRGSAWLVSWRAS